MLIFLIINSYKYANNLKNSSGCTITWLTFCCFGKKGKKVKLGTSVDNMQLCKISNFKVIYCLLRLNYNFYIKVSPINIQKIYMILFRNVSDCIRYLYLEIHSMRLVIKWFTTKIFLIYAVLRMAQICIYHSVFEIVLSN